MHFAAAGGDFGIFQTLLDNGCDVTGRDKQSLTVLHYAAKYGHQEIISYLWLSDDNIVRDNATEFRSQTGIMPLHLAAESGSVECVEFLIDNGSDIDAQTFEGNTPLHYSVSHIETMECLIDHGCDIHIKNNYGKTAFELAMKKGTIETAQYVLNKKIELKEDCSDIFFAAAESSNIDIFNLFVEKGIDMNYENHLGETALHLAAKGGNIEFVTFLVENGADPNWEDHNGVLF